MGYVRKKPVTENEIKKSIANANANWLKRDAKSKKSNNPSWNSSYLKLTQKTNHELDKMND